jgi:hypothetical protein
MYISHHDNNTLVLLTCQSGLKANPEAAQHYLTHALIGQHGSFRGQHQYTQNLQQKCRTNQNVVFCAVTSCNTVHMSIRVSEEPPASVFRSISSTRRYNPAKQNINIQSNPI